MPIDPDENSRSYLESVGQLLRPLRDRNKWPLPELRNEVGWSDRRLGEYLTHLEDVYDPPPLRTGLLGRDQTADRPSAANVLEGWQLNKHRYVRLADLECNESHCDRDPALWTLCALPIEARCLYHEAADVAVNLAYEQGEIHRDDIGRFIETAVEVWENQAVPPTAFDDEAVEKVLNVLEANDG